MDDLATLIHGLGHARAHVFGVSFGGAIALQLAVSRPGVIATLTLGATLPRIHLVPRTAAGELTALPPEQRDTRMLDFVLSEKRRRDPGLLAETRGILVHQPPVEDARRLDAVNGFDVTDRLATITVPTQPIYGAEDPAATAEHGRTLAQAIPGTKRIEILPRICHGSTLEGKHQVAALLRDFVLPHPHSS